MSALVIPVGDRMESGYPRAIENGYPRAIENGAGERLPRRPDR